MRLATAEQSKKIDLKAQNEFGLSGEILMEGAGAAAAQMILNSFPSELRNGPISIICGSGHNGGDGLVVARWLACRGIANLKVFLTGNSSEMKALALLQHQRLRGLGILCDVWDKKLHAPVLENSRLIIDALFGVGLTRETSGPAAEMIEVSNRSNAPIVSLDVPSGLNCDTGWVMGSAMRAHTTLSFGLAKPGFFLRQGPKHAGRVKAISISFPVEVEREIANTHFLLSSDWVRSRLPKRSNHSNKSNHGRLIICAGSQGKWGAALMAGEAAFRVGAGYVVAAGFDSELKSISKRPEIMTEKLDSMQFELRHAYCVGPGLGTGDETKEVISKLYEENCRNVVLDADALTVLAKGKLSLHPEWVVTPHAGELGRLLGIGSEEVESNPIAAAQKAAKKFKCNVLLKGFHSILVHGSKVVIIPTGNSALAKAGTGDVLTGMIGGLMAQGMSPANATAAGAFIHGLAADQWLRSGRDKRSLLASDICEALPLLLKQVSQGLTSPPSWATL